MTTVMDCIERIPAKLEALLQQREEHFQELKEYCSHEQIHKIVFIASGTSYHGALSARSFFEELNFQTSYVYPNMFVNYTKQLDCEALHVFISQGGTTKLVYEGVKKAKAAGCKTCSITADVQAPIAKLADVALSMGCGEEEFLYRTLGYSTTVATCYLMAMALHADDAKIPAYLAEFQCMIRHLPIIKNITLEWYRRHRFSLMRKDHMLFAGTNDLWPVCMEADIKVMEMVPMLTRSFELEEFIHGPQNAFDESSAYLLFARKGEDDEKVKAIASFLKKEIGFCCLIGNLAEDARDLYFEESGTHFSALEYVTAAQVIAYKLADDHGRDLSRPVNGVIKQYVTKTL